MAEAFAVAAGVLAFLSSAAAIVKATCALASDLKDASSYISGLAKELQDYEKVLNDFSELEERIQNISDSTILKAGLSVELSRECLTELEDLQRLLEDSRVQLAGGRMRRLWYRLDWAIRKKRQIESHTARITAQKGSLTSALGVLQSHVLLIVDGHVQQVHGCIKQVGAVARASSNQTSKSLSAVQQEIQQISTHSTTATELQRVIHKVTSESLSVTKEASETTGDIQRSLMKIDEKLENLRGHKIHALSFGSEGLIRVNLEPRNLRYYGRTDIFIVMAEELLPNNSPSARLQSFALHGMAGVGKTQTALEFAHRNADVYEAILWVSAENKEKLTQGFVDVARALCLSETDLVEDRDKSIASVQQWFMITDKRWLLVLDNADQLENLKDVWPITDKGAVIVTSQNPTSGSCWASKGIELGPLSKSDGLALTRHLLGPKSKEGSDRDLVVIPESLGYLPLAIDQMVSFILETDCTVSSFQQMYKDREQADELQNTPAAGTRRYSKTVAAAFGLALDRISENACSTIKCLAFFDPDQIPERLLSDSTGKIPYLSRDLARETIFKELRSFTLIRRNPASGTLAIHRLLRDAAIRSLQSDIQKRQTAFDNAVHLISQVFPRQAASRDHMTEVWAGCEVYVQHVISLHDTFTRIDPKNVLHISADFVDTLYNCSWYMFERGRFEISFALARTAEELYGRANFQDGKLLLADIYSVQGCMRLEIKDTEMASNLFQKAMTIREDAVAAGLLDPDHPNRAHSYMNLGVSFTNDDPYKAIKLHENALSIRLRSSKYAQEQMQSLALNYLNIGRCFILVQELDEAAQALARCLTILDLKERQTGQKFALSAWALWSMGNIEITRGNLDEAFDLHTRSMELNNAVLGSTHRKTIACYHKIAWFLHRRGDLERAEKLLRETLSMYQEKTGSDVEGHVARTKYKLAAVLHDIGQITEALVMKREAQEIRFKLNGKRPDQDDHEESYDELVLYFYR